jgi:hypothetical protein
LLLSATELVWEFFALRFGHPHLIKEVLNRSVQISPWGHITMDQGLTQYTIDREPWIERPYRILKYHLDISSHLLESRVIFVDARFLE